MHSESVRQFGYRRPRSAARSCEPAADLADQLSQSYVSAKDCCSQPGSSVSALSDMLMSSPAEVQLESDLQCEERHQFLSSPQDSNTSALSYHDPGFISPMPIPASRCFVTPPQIPSPRLQDSQPSPSEVPTEALWDTENVACHGERPFPPPRLLLLLFCQPCILCLVSSIAMPVLRYTCNFPCTAA